MPPIHKVQACLENNTPGMGSVVGMRVVAATQRLPRSHLKRSFASPAICLAHGKSTFSNSAAVKQGKDILLGSRAEGMPKLCSSGSDEGLGNFFESIATYHSNYIRYFITGINSWLQRSWEWDLLLSNTIPVKYVLQHPTLIAVNCTAVGLELPEAKAVVRVLFHVKHLSLNM